MNILRLDSHTKISRRLKIIPVEPQSTKGYFLGGNIVSIKFRVSHVIRNSIFDVSIRYSLINKRQLSTVKPENC